MEGYGQTECTAGVSTTLSYDVSTGESAHRERQEISTVLKVLKMRIWLHHVGRGISGHVGAPIPSNAIKLVDVPEMEYFARDNKGEVRVCCNKIYNS